MSAIVLKRAESSEGPPVTRPALRYHGSKWLAAPWIIRHFPEHHCYVEMFGGGASVLLRKEPSALEVYNDTDGQVVNFFRVLRERPAELIALLEATPYAREELHLSYERSDDPLEDARRTFVRMWQGHGGSRANWKTGWRYQRNINQRRSVIADWHTHDRLMAVASRLRLAQIECGTALDVIRRFDSPETLFYADPPYMAETRSERWRTVAYGAHEMDEAAHRELAAALHEVRGLVVLSGYPSPMYEELYAGWPKSTKTMPVDGRPHRSGDKLQRRRTEALWLSPRASESSRQLAFDVGASS